MKLSRRSFLSGGSAGALALLARPSLSSARGLLTEPRLDDLLKRTLAAATKAGASYADVRVVRIRREGIATREDRVERVSSLEEYGVGVRVISRFWYLRPLDRPSLTATGLTRDGVYLIENGVITHAVNNFRFNESPVQMLAKCDGLGPTAIPGGGGNGGSNRVPMLRTHEFNLASISDAV